MLEAETIQRPTLKTPAEIAREAELARRSLTEQGGLGLTVPETVGGLLQGELFG